MVRCYQLGNLSRLYGNVFLLVLRLVYRSEITLKEKVKEITQHIVRDPILLLTKVRE